jgi:hypothetical protein
MHPDLAPRGPLGRLLRALPEEAQPPYDFHEFRRRAAAQMETAHSSRKGHLLATAASIAVLAVVLLLRLGLSPSPRIASGALTAPVVVTPAGSARPEVMERWLAGFPEDPALVRVGTRAAVTGLEDRIAQLDDLLSAARLERAQRARLDALQQERTRLLGALVQVRYAETLADAAQ